MVVSDEFDHHHQGSLEKEMWIYSLQTNDFKPQKHSSCSKDKNLIELQQIHKLPSTTDNRSKRMSIPSTRIPPNLEKRNEERFESRNPRCPNIQDLRYVGASSPVVVYDTKNNLNGNIIDNSV